MQKILIFTVTAGNGHNAVANALKQKLIDEGKTVKIVDLFKEYDTKLKHLIINDGYLFLSTQLTNVYNNFFEYYSNINPNRRDSGATQDFLKGLSAKTLKTIYSYRPDVILCTHLYPAIIITNLKKAFPINAKVIAFLTDYIVHPFWESTIGIDYIITPSEHLTDTLLYKGFSLDQIKCLGYPIQDKFSETISKQAACKKLKLDSNVLTVCVTCGGYGYVKMPKLIRQLLNVKYPLQIISVCGRNKISKRKIDKIKNDVKLEKTNKKILNYGYSNDIDLLFSASDIMVSKGGCTFINEAMSKTLPQIFIKNLPFQEQYNAEYMQDNNAGLIATKDFDIDKIVNMLCANPQKINDLKQNIIKIRKPNAINDICKFILSINNNATYNEQIAFAKSRYINKEIRKANKANRKKSYAINMQYKTYKKINKIKKSTKQYKNKVFKSINKKAG